MCTAVYKPENVNAPSYKKLKRCFHKNDDGAGIAVLRPENSQIYVEKGFFTWQNFKSRVKELDVRQKDIVIYHFRLATHGGTSKSMCHPFPVTDSENALRFTSYWANDVFAHNGILHTGYTSTLSDSAVFVRDYLSQCIDDVMENKAVSEFYEDYVYPSKTVILRNDGSAFLAGSWEKDKTTGIFYSNDDYKKKKKTQKKTSHTFGGVNVYTDDDLDDDWYANDYYVRQGIQDSYRKQHKLETEETATCYCPHCKTAGQKKFVDVPICSHCHNEMEIIETEDDIMDMLDTEDTQSLLCEKTCPTCQLTMYTNNKTCDVCQEKLIISEDKLLPSKL